MQQPRACETRQTVFIIDDEPNLRVSLLNFFQSMQMQAATFDSAEAFLSEAGEDAAGCILLDVQMPGMSGLELQAELSKIGVSLPLIFMTGNASVPLTVSAMKAGAFDFLLKPFNSQAILETVQRALEHEKGLRYVKIELEEIRAKLAKLTPREMEVWSYVSQGLMNKQIAFEMGISEIMVKLHRGRMMKKMKARSVVEVARMFDRVMPSQAVGAVGHDTDRSQPVYDLRRSG